MSDPAVPEQPRRPRFGDIRDDFDDDFGRVRSPREIVRRLLVVPGVAHVVIGVYGILGLLALSGRAFVAYLDDNWGLDELVPMEAIVFVGMCLLALATAGGASMLRLRRRRLALFGAYAVATLSLAGAYAILFYPFGIWGLIVLYRPDVRREFDRPPLQSQDDDH
jgi:hypothetical protein